MYSDDVVRQLFYQIVVRLRDSLGKPKPFHYKLAILLGVREQEVRSWEGGGLPDEQTVWKALRLQMLLDALGNQVNAEDRIGFLLRFHQGLSGLRPIDCLDSASAAAEVRQLVFGDRNGGNEIPQG